MQPVTRHPAELPCCDTLPPGKSPLQAAGNLLALAAGKPLSNVVRNASANAAQAVLVA